MAGPHRSGTSLVAGLLGSSVGSLPVDLMRPALSNAKGFNESWSIVHLNEFILRESGLTWDSVEPTGKQIFKESFQKKFYAKCLDCFLENFPKSSPDGSSSVVLKDPRFCRTFPIWKKTLLELDYKIHVVIPLRSPVDVMYSLMKRDDIDAASAVLIWYWHIVEILIHTEKMDVRFVVYDRLLEDPSEHLRLALGIKISDSTADLIDGKLNHSKQHDTLARTYFEEEPFNSSLLLYENLLNSPMPDTGVISKIKSSYFFNHVLKAHIERKHTLFQKRLIREITSLNGLSEKENIKKFRNGSHSTDSVSSGEHNGQENETKKPSNLSNLLNIFKKP